MCTMSKKSIAEYVTEKRRVYTKSGSAKRTRLLDEIRELLSVQHLTNRNPNVNYRVHVLLDEPRGLYRVKQWKNQQGNHSEMLMA